MAHVIRNARARAAGADNLEKMSRDALRQFVRDLKGIDGKAKQAETTVTVNGREIRLSTKRVGASSSG